MKLRIALSLVIVAAAAGLATRALWQNPPARSLAEFVPAGPMLYLESGDFGALVHDWNGSQEKKLWLGSASYDVFSRSRLFTRLGDAQGEFASVAGLPPNMSLVESVAGDQSALALYDVGKLEFLYITRLASARAIESALWRTRSAYETRKAAGFDYFVKNDPATHRTAAFAAAKDYLLLATREDLIPGALKLIAGAGGNAITSEEWFAAPVREAGQPGDIRLVMNVPLLVRSPHFRSYWVQENVTELKQYGAALADIHRSSREIREDRVLLRFGEAPPAADSAALGQALALVPEDAGLYRAWANPSPAAALELLSGRVIDPRALGGHASEDAPTAPVTAQAGSTEDLETRIDEPPLANTAGGFDPAALDSLLKNAKLEAALEVGSTRVLADGVFVGVDTAVALLAASDWKPDAVRAALSTAAETGPLGRIAFEARGKVLIVANSSALLKAIVARIPEAPAKVEGAYAGRFNAARERPNFARLTRLIDHAGGPEPSEGSEPRFFSANMTSLGRTLARVQSSSIAVSDSGRAVHQTVTYRFGQ